MKREMKIIIALVALFTLINSANAQNNTALVKSSIPVEKFFKSENSFHNFKT
jgi:hypothetical protein